MSWYISGNEWGSGTGGTAWLQIQFRMSMIYGLSVDVIFHLISVIECRMCYSIIINWKIKLLTENKLIICALGNLHYQISREKFEPEPGFEAILVLMPARSTKWQSVSWPQCLAKVVSVSRGRFEHELPWESGERWARYPEVRGSNPGSGSNFPLEIW